MRRRSNASELKLCFNHVSLNASADTNDCKAPYMNNDELSVSDTQPERRNFPESLQGFLIKRSDQNSQSARASNRATNSLKNMQIDSNTITIGGSTTPKRPGKYRLRMDLNAHNVGKVLPNQDSSAGTAIASGHSELSRSPSALPRRETATKKKKAFRLELGLHEFRFSEEQVLLDLSCVTGIKEGDLAELKTYQGKNGSKGKKIYFIVKAFDRDLRKRYKNAQISILSGQLQHTLGLPSRSKVWVKVKDKESTQADVVEINVKDCLIHRGDMWVFSSEITGGCVYCEQKLTFVDSVRATVKAIYREGKKVLSGYIGNQTKVVFRSESARLIFLIQITDEMWHFEENGDIYFYKVVNSVFPTIFKKWKNIGTHHTITIVFSASLDFSDVAFKDLPEGERPKNTKDYYRIVVDQVNIVHWTEIMKTLRREFKNIAKDLKTFKTEDGTSVLKGRFSPVIKSNILETMCLAATFVTNPFRQPDLRRTVAHVIIVSPGTGIYDVDYDLLKATSTKIQSLELSIDVLCLARPPLHIVPLLRFRDYENKLRYCAPSWINISFWRHSSNSSVWYPRCKMHDLQMMGLTETEMKEQVEIDYMDAPSAAESVMAMMKNHDEDIFSSQVPTDNVQDRYSVSSAPSNGKKATVKKSFKEISGKAPLAWNPPKSASPMVQSTASLQVFGDLAQSASTGLLDDKETKSSFTKLDKGSQKDSRAINTLKNATKSSNIAQRLVSKFLPETEPKNKKTSTNLPYNSSDSQSRHLVLGNSPDIDDNGVHQQWPVLKKNLSSFERPDRKKTPFDVSSFCSQSFVGSPNRFTDSPRRSIDSPRPKNVAKELPQDMSATLFSWLEIKNVSRPISSERAGHLIAPQWKDVFPRYVAKKYSKWRSLTTPAELPITISSFPAKEDFEKNFTFTNHSVISNPDQEVGNQTAFDLLRDMIYVRLLAGFQICVGDSLERLESSKNNEGDTRRITKILTKHNYMDVKFFMMLGEEIHRLTCTLDGTIDVQRHIRKKLSESSFGVPTYCPEIKTRYENQYREIMTDPLKMNREKVNWNQLDQMLAGYEDSIIEQNKKRFRSKFVILPADVPENTISSTINGRSETLSAEEIRLEGFRRLISSIYRARLRNAQDEVSRSSRKEEIAPEVIFYTGSLFTFIDEQAEILRSSGKVKHDTIFIRDEDKLSKKVSLSKLAQEMQHGKNSLNLVNRKWHWKRHNNCFIGSEFVNWLIENFLDIDTRDEAVIYGQDLMYQGLFVHVENRHGFLDGHYFYHFSPDYVHSSEVRDPPQDQRSLYTDENARRVSAPDGADSKLSRIGTGDAVVGDEGSMSNSKLSTHKPTVLLSNMITVNADSAGKSYKPEVCRVHYDRVHNPDHCFHIRLEWLTATPKLIDDLINNWARLCKRYGLNLVEVPWVELCTIPLSNPFHTFVDITLAINPWEDPEFKDEQLISQSPYYYHTFLLEKSGFLIDNRASQLLNQSVTDHEVMYSWGKPKFKYAQYIHLTGAYIAEIRENGNLFLAPNNRHLSRVNVDSVTLKVKQSPTFALDAQKIMLAFKGTCLDYEKLRSIFLDAKGVWQSDKSKPL